MRCVAQVDDDTTTKKKHQSGSQGAPPVRMKLLNCVALSEKARGYARIVGRRRKKRRQRRLMPTNIQRKKKCLLLLSMRQGMPKKRLTVRRFLQEAFANSFIFTLCCLFHFFFLCLFFSFCWLVLGITFERKAVQNLVPVYRPPFPLLFPLVW